jgi:hypothetical protein
VKAVVHPSQRVIVTPRNRLSSQNIDATLYLPIGATFGPSYNPRQRVLSATAFRINMNNMKALLGPHAV